jgi:valyl-tRNA synthetase
MELAKRPEFKEYEGRINQMWVEAKIFTPIIDHTKKPFTILLPAPYAKAAVHGGHPRTLPSDAG